MWYLYVICRKYDCLKILFKLTPTVEHITPVLWQLHWLPVRQRVLFKRTTLVYCLLAGTALVNLSNEWCHLTSFVGVRSLCSTDSQTCVPRHAYNGYGDRCFAAASPSLWNSLPVQFQEPDISFNSFKTLSKTFLFFFVFFFDGDHGALRLIVKSAVYKYAYLLTYWFINLRLY